MGKVLKIIAVIAIAAAIAYFAPTLGLTALHALGIGAVAGSGIALAAGAVVASVLGIAASAAMTALAGAPHTGTAPGSQSSLSQPVIMGGLRFEYPPDPPVRCSPPIRDRWWRDPMFLPWETVASRATVGSCMAPILPAGKTWVVVDRDATIQAGDICLFRPDDIDAYLRHGGHDPRNSGGLVKRFVGIDPERRVMVYYMMSKDSVKNRMETGIDRVQHLYRVRSWHPTWWAATKARWTGGRP